ncbi:hypothetical protein ACIBEK_07130 [Nocardia fusca]|uniref:hypothetical protein n=1 Tax=Nocardia fusca TaxID=941183 RepID=UPI0037A28A40
MNLSELCFHLKNRPRMYVMDDRFTTAVAFVEGFNQANDGRTLSGFQSFVINQLNGGKRSSLHWSSLIAKSEFSSTLDNDVAIMDLSPEAQRALINRMIDLLMEYDACQTGEEPPSHNEMKNGS